MISQQRLEEFKKIIKEDYGYEFTDDAEAREAAQNFVGFFEVLLKMDREQKIIG